MNYRHLYYFWSVAKTGHLTQAAQQLHVSQSALSSQIKQLEEWLGQTLFEREGRRLKLTQAGYIAKQYADRIFAEGQSLIEQLKQGKTSQATVVRIGHASTMSRNFVEQFIAPLMSATPQPFRLHSMSTHQLLTELAEHRIDIALANTDVAGHDEDIWQSRLLARQPVSIIGIPGLPIQSLADPALCNRAWVLPPTSAPLRSGFDMLATQYQWSPQIIAEADDMAMLRLLARDGGALAVIPDVVVKDELDSRRLQRYVTLPNLFEQFYAITIKQPFQHPWLSRLLARYD
ncbi:LysR family transcriptional regulator [Idiomarina sp.]|uniref:LysR family transcriptional regulator n=1 Tax=Idiomarina sp. TaxID=1874361 RepID=UPI0025BF6C1C|nr:LysR family transcriptional regulator [Idiomarina sp.]NQZ03572.1 LysR family transcriptional regulator [Idiomarina sp.]